MSDSAKLTAYYCIVCIAKMEQQHIVRERESAKNDEEEEEETRSNIIQLATIIYTHTVYRIHLMFGKFFRFDYYEHSRYRKRGFIHTVHKENVNICENFSRLFVTRSLSPAPVVRLVRSLVSLVHANCMAIKRDANEHTNNTSNEWPFIITSTGNALCVHFVCNIQCSCGSATNKHTHSLAYTLT